MPTSRYGRCAERLLWLWPGLPSLPDCVALMSELLDKGWDTSIAASSLALLIGQLTLTRSGPAPAPLTFWIGVGTLPALAVGGALAEIDERLLEIPLVCVGLAWMRVGWVTLRNRDLVPAPP